MASPALYTAEKARVAARFEESVKLAEAAFAEELAILVGRLQDALLPSKDGKRHVLRESAVDGFSEFITKFRGMGIGMGIDSHAGLNTVVGQLDELLRGVTATELRSDSTARAAVSETLGTIANSMESLIGVAGRRKVVRAKVDNKEPANAA